MNILVRMSQLMLKIVITIFAILSWGLFAIIVEMAVYSTCLGFKGYILPLCIIFLVSVMTTYFLRNDIFSFKQGIKDYKHKTLNQTYSTFLSNAIVNFITISILLLIALPTTKVLKDFGSSTYLIFLINMFHPKFYVFYFILPAASLIVYISAKVGKKDVSLHNLRKLHLTSVTLLMINTFIFWIGLLALYYPIVNLGNCEV